MRRICALVAVVLPLAACSAFQPDVGPLRGGTDASVSSSDAGRADASADGGNADAAPTTYTVVVGPNGAHAFSPAELVVHAGDTVHWVWETSGHTVTSGTSGADGVFCSPGDADCANTPTSAAGTTYAHTFTTPGSFPYFCRPHRPMMSGRIVVE